MEIDKYIGDKNKIVKWLVDEIIHLETGEKIIRYLLIKEWNTNLQMNWSFFEETSFQKFLAFFVGPR